MKKTRIFFDMDGTLAEWRPAAALEDLYQEGYFLSLSPQENVVEAARALCESSDVEVYTLSAVLSDSYYSLTEKNLWLDEYLPCIDRQHRLFCPTGKNKADYVVGGVERYDILVDDYSKNLHEWAEKGTAIKLLNGVNGTKGTWQGRSVDKLWNPKAIIHDAMYTVGEVEGGFKACCKMFAAGELSYKDALSFSRCTEEEFAGWMREFYPDYRI